LIFYVDGLLETKNSQAVCSDDIWQSRTHSYTKYFSVSQDTMDQEHKAYINLSFARKVNVPSCSIFASSFPSIILMLIQKFRCIFCFIAHNQDFIEFVAHIRVRMSTTVLYARPSNLFIWGQPPFPASERQRQTCITKIHWANLKVSDYFFSLASFAFKAELDVLVLCPTKKCLLGRSSFAGSLANIYSTHPLQN
jgi:hypothetical protein